ncbi:Eukaryotic translation initiation factor 5 [Giardia muris]|uniref:Eukaryotic translation initiation factor 5 n=1 Tax=Giardia muris TaxID=5742 RepID=A0A4Z1SUS8_GIAMU|nr:Eukaryotic translation initiation factor 5 [Giardia muris]|eukprot:TNJ29596.1 Eukaryotic translation initiation factor 5 [Giardia muris]
MVRDTMNVNYTDDPNYRYKMPVPDVSHRGRGNKAHFVIRNIRELAEVLGRTPQDLAKFLQYSLGNLATYNAGDGTWKFTGLHDQATILRVLRSFIFTHVICHHCQIPETTYELSDGVLSLKCAACGKATHLPKDQYTAYLVKLLQPKEVTLQKLPTGAFANVRNMLASDLTLEKKASDLQKRFDEYQAQRCVTDGERVYFILAAIFAKADPTPEFITLVTDVLKALITQDSDRIHVLYALECVVRKYEEHMLNTQTNLLSFTLQRLLLGGIVNEPSIQSWANPELSQPIVPGDYHSRVLECAKPFLAWFEAQRANGEDSDDEYEYDEDEDEEESD